MAMFSIQTPLMPPASNALLLFDQNRFEETVAFCQKELLAIEKQISAKSVKLPEDGDGKSPPFQYYALTMILVKALAELERWKPAKEALGRYRAHFPKDPWGFQAGAQVTRLDPEVKDRAAVQRAAELLEKESKRLTAMEKRKAR